MHLIYIAGQRQQLCRWVFILKPSRLSTYLVSFKTLYRHSRCVADGEVLCSPLQRPADRRHDSSPPEFMCNSAPSVTVCTMEVIETELRLCSVGPRDNTNLHAPIRSYMGRIHCPLFIRANPCIGLFAVAACPNQGKSTGTPPRIVLPTQTPICRLRTVPVYARHIPLRQVSSLRDICADTVRCCNRYLCQTSGVSSNRRRSPIRSLIATSHSAQQCACRITIAVHSPAPS